MLRQLLLGLRILVADSDYFNAEETCQYLADAGAQICGPVPSNDEALRWIKGDLPDGLVLSTRLRNGSPRSTLAEIERHGLPCILVDAGLGAMDDWPSRAPVLQLPLTGARPLELISNLFGARPMAGDGAALGEVHRA